MLDVLFHLIKSSELSTLQDRQLEIMTDLSSITHVALKILAAFRASSFGVDPARTSTRNSI